MKKICVTSDLHGYLPEIPDCDLLLLCGDYSPNPKYEEFWLKNVFRPWIDKLSERMTIIGCAGNHDILFEKEPSLIPKMNWIYLQDELVEWNGIKIYGSPWQPRFFDWAFNLEEYELADKWEMIPDDVDILITHGPPYKILDLSPYGNKNVGSYTLAEKVLEIQPKIHAFGHIHNSRNKIKIGKTIFINASYVDEQYSPYKKEIEVIEI